MKILEKKEQKWELEIICKESGWRGEKENCGSKLLIDKDDIYCRIAFKYPDNEWKTYGIICPVCNNYVEINEKLIPASIKEKAKSYKINWNKKEGNKMIEIITKMQPINYIKLEDLEVKCSDFLDIMEDLEDTDIMERLVIYNDEIAKYLTEKGLAKQNVKGSYQKTELFDKVWPKLREEYYEKLDKISKV